MDTIRVPYAVFEQSQSDDRRLGGSGSRHRRGPPTDPIGRTSYHFLAQTAAPPSLDVSGLWKVTRSKRPARTSVWSSDSWAINIRQVILVSLPNALRLDKTDVCAYVHWHSLHASANESGRFLVGSFTRTSMGVHHAIYALHDRVLVRRIEGEEKTKGGLIVPDTAKEKPSEGEVIAVGEGARREDGELIPMAVKAGDRILFGKWSGTEVKLDGEDLLKAAAWRRA